MNYPEIIFPTVTEHTPTTEVTNVTYSETYLNQSVLLINALVPFSIVAIFSTVKCIKYLRKKCTSNMDQEANIECCVQDKKLSI